MKLYFNTTKVLFKLAIDNSFVTSLVAFQYYKSTLQTRRPGRRDGRRRSISILQKYSSNPCLAWARISSQFISILQKYSSNSQPVSGSCIVKANFNTTKVLFKLNRRQIYFYYYAGISILQKYSSNITMAQG